MTSPGEQRRPDEGGPGQTPPYPSPEQQGYRPGAYGPTPYDDPGDRAAPPYVYNPYANVSYPPTYPAPPAGLGADDRVPARRPASVHVALALLVVAAVPYLLFGTTALLGATEAVSALPPEQLDQVRAAGLDPEQLVRTMAVLVLGVALVFLLLAVLAWAGRRWARALLAAMTVGFVLMALVVVVASAGQGAAGLLVPGFFLALAVAGIVLMFGSGAREWFSRVRR